MSGGQSPAFGEGGTAGAPWESSLRISPGVGERRDAPSRMLSTRAFRPCLGRGSSARSQSAQTSAAAAEAKEKGSSECVQSARIRHNPWPDLLWSYLGRLQLWRAPLLFGMSPWLAETRQWRRVRCQAQGGGGGGGEEASSPAEKAVAWSLSLCPLSLPRALLPLPRRGSGVGSSAG